MTRLQAYRFKRLNKQFDALLVRARKHARPHVQSPFQIGYVPPLQHLAPRSEKPRGRYLLLIVAVVISLVCINVTKPHEAAAVTKVAGK